MIECAKHPQALIVSKYCWRRCYLPCLREGELFTPTSAGCQWDLDLNCVEQLNYIYGESVRTCSVCGREQLQPRSIAPISWALMYGDDMLGRGRVFRGKIWQGANWEPEKQLLAIPTRGGEGMKAVICPICNGAGQTYPTKNPLGCTPTSTTGGPYRVTCHGCGGRGWVEVKE